MQIYCGECGQKIKEIEDGYVEIVYNPESEYIQEIAIVHHPSASPKESCFYVDNHNEIGETLHNGQHLKAILERLPKFIQHISSFYIHIDDHHKILDIISKLVVLRDRK